MGGGGVLGCELLATVYLPVRVSRFGSQGASSRKLACCFGGYGILISDLAYTVLLQYLSHALFLIVTYFLLQSVFFSSW